MKILYIILGLIPLVNGVRLFMASGISFGVVALCLIGLLIVAWGIRYKS